MNHVLESSMMGRAGDIADHGREQGCQLLEPVSWDFREEQSPAGAAGVRCWPALPLSSVLFRTSPHPSELLGKQHPQERAKTHVQLKMKGTLREEGVESIEGFIDRTHSMGRGEGLGVMRGWQLGCSRDV